MSLAREIELVRAGPGTGKTYQLSQRFAALVLENHDPARIGVVTFTRAAAAELRERVRGVLEEHKVAPDVLARIDDAPMLTIDAFSNWVLRMSVDHRFASTTPVSALLGSASRARRSQRALIEGARQETESIMRLGLPYRPPSFGGPSLMQLVNAVVDHPARVREGDWIDIVTAGKDRWPGLSDGDIEAVLDAAVAFGEREAMDRLMSGETSYEDTTALAVAFVESEIGQKKIRESLSALLVDELQDTDPLQERLFHAIWSVQHPDGGRAIERFMVGDLKQAIYQFRNADPKVMERFIKATPKDLQGDLVQNRRSAAPIVDVLNIVAAKWFASEPRLTPLEPDSAGSFMLLGSNPVGNPNNAAKPAAAGEVRRREAADIANLLVAQRDSWQEGTCALLVPRRTALGGIERALVEAGLPVLNLADAPYKSPEVEEMRVLLSAISNPGDDIATVGALRGPAFAVSDEDLDRAIQPGNASLREQLLTGPEPVAAAVKKLDSFRSLALGSSVGELIETVLSELHLWDIGGPNRFHWLATQAFEFDRRGGGSLGRFLLHLDAIEGGDRNLSEQVAPTPGAPAIQLMTMHRAKGLEFDTVIVAGLLFGKKYDPPFCRWAHDHQSNCWRLRVNLGNEDQDQEQAEHEQMKRLLYVALSRAKTNLVVATHHHDGTTLSNDPCQLLRSGLAGVATSNALTLVSDPGQEQPSVEQLPEPVDGSSIARPATVSELVAETGSGGGSGADHGTAVHAVISAVLHHYEHSSRPPISELLGVLDGFELSPKVRSEARTVLELPMITDAVAEQLRIESEYPVSGLIDGRAVHGVVDIMVFGSEGQISIGDIKTDLSGESDPVGTNYDSQLEMYKKLSGADLALLLGSQAEQ